MVGLAALDPPYTLEEDFVAVRIRMKRFGRKHRPFYRICALDIRRPRDGRVLEELGTYDPMVPETDARALINGERVQYWLSVGALPSENVKVLIKKYGINGTHIEQQKVALDRLAQSKRRAAPPPVAAQPAEAVPAAEEAHAAEAAPTE
jgi:small subunit ribosomal protein S16